MRLTHVARGHLALALAATLFGGLNMVLEVGLRRPGGDDSVADKIGRATCFALYRDVGAALLLGGASVLRSSSRRQWRQPAVQALWSDWQAFSMVIACGLFGIFAQLGFIVGLVLTSADLAALFQPTAPVFTVALSALLRAERCTAAKALAITLGLAGSLVMVDFAVCRFGPSAPDEQTAADDSATHACGRPLRRDRTRARRDCWAWHASASICSASRSG